MEINNFLRDKLSREALIRTIDELASSFMPPLLEVAPPPPAPPLRQVFPPDLTATSLVLAGNRPAVIEAKNSLETARAHSTLRLSTVDGAGNLVLSVRAGTLWGARDGECQAINVPGGVVTGVRVYSRGECNPLALVTTRTTLSCIELLPRKEARQTKVVVEKPGEEKSSKPTKNRGEKHEKQSKLPLSTVTHEVLPPSPPPSTPVPTTLCWSVELPASGLADAALAPVPSAPGRPLCAAMTPTGAVVLLRAGRTSWEVLYSAAPSPAPAAESAPPSLVFVAADTLVVSTHATLRTIVITPPDALDDGLDGTPPPAPPITVLPPNALLGSPVCGLASGFSSELPPPSPPDQVLAALTRLSTAPLVVLDPAALTFRDPFVPSRMLAARPHLLTGAPPRTLRLAVRAGTTVAWAWCVAAVATRATAAPAPVCAVPVSVGVPTLTANGYAVLDPATVLVSLACGGVLAFTPGQLPVARVASAEASHIIQLALPTLPQTLLDAAAAAAAPAVTLRPMPGDARPCPSSVRAQSIAQLRSSFAGEQPDVAVLTQSRQRRTSKASKAGSDLAFISQQLNTKSDRGTPAHRMPAADLRQLLHAVSVRQRPLGETADLQGSMPVPTKAVAKRHVSKSKRVVGLLAERAEEEASQASQASQGSQGSQGSQASTWEGSIWSQAAGGSSAGLSSYGGITQDSQRTEGGTSQAPQDDGSAFSLKDLSAMFLQM